MLMPPCRKTPHPQTRGYNESGLPKNPEADAEKYQAMSPQLRTNDAFTLGAGEP